MRTFLRLPNGIPSLSTISRVFINLSPERLADCFKQNVLELQELNQYLLNIDGKVLRGTAEKGKKKSGICILSEWSSELNLVLGQVKMDSKSNEKTAIPILLNHLDLKNTIVTIDAIACSHAIAEQIVVGGGNYVLAVKGNKKGLEEEIKDWLKRDRADFDVFQKTDYVGGRIEEQIYTVCSDLQHLCQSDLLYNSQSIIKVFSKRTTNKIVQEETRYYISSLKTDAKSFEKYIKGHWSIENQLYWHLDVSFNEDSSRIRTDNAPENMNIIRKIALQMLQQMNDKRSIKGRRLRAGWNNNYLLAIAANVVFMNLT